MENIKVMKNVFVLMYWDSSNILNVTLGSLCIPGLGTNWHLVSS
jgi:hypothetical protein